MKIILFEKTFVCIDDQRNSGNERQRRTDVSESNEPKGEIVECVIAFFCGGIVDAVHPSSSDEKPGEL